MKDATATDPLAEACGAYDFSLRLRSVVIADVVALVCMPAGILLDYFVNPERVWQFLKIRLGVAGILLLIPLVLAATRSWKNRAIVIAAGVLSTIEVNLSFCLMVFMTEGAQSPYYAGINLVMLIMTTLLPWRVWETALVCGVSLGC